MKRRHHIVGSEAGQQRPPAYMRRGRTRRVARRPRRPIVYAFGLSLLLALIWLAFRGVIP